MAFTADLEFAWGHASRQIGLSKSPPSFLYPPPTTIVGALAASLARDNGWGESKGRELMRLVGSKLLAISFKPLNFIPVRFQDINRIITVKVGKKRYPHPAELGSSFDAPARGKTMFISLDGRPPQMRIYLVFSDTHLGDRVVVKEEHFWHIARLGAKEALVTVVEVDSQDAKVGKGEFVISTAFPLLSGVERKDLISGEWAAETYINPFDKSSYASPLHSTFDEAKTVDYFVPKGLVKGRYLVDVRGDSAVYLIGDDAVIGIEGGS